MSATPKRHSPRAAPFHRLALHDHGILAQSRDWLRRFAAFSGQAPAALCAAHRQELRRLAGPPGNESNRSRSQDAQLRMGWWGRSRQGAYRSAKSPKAPIQSAAEPSSRSVASPASAAAIRSAAARTISA